MCLERLKGQTMLDTIKESFCVDLELGKTLSFLLAVVKVRKENICNYFPSKNTWTQNTQRESGIWHLISMLLNHLILTKKQNCEQLKRNQTF